MITLIDMTELLGSAESTIQDVFVAGAVGFPHYSLHQVEQDLRTIKQDILGHPWIPVKWNVRDVEKWMTNQEERSAYKDLVAKSDDIRRAFMRYLVERASDGAFGLIGVITPYGKTRKEILHNKKRLIGYVFSNVLQRLALEAKHRNRCDEFATVVIDWPDGADSKPFLDEYCAAWERGCTAESSNYYAGPLSALRFAEGPLFASCRRSPGIQLADVFVGSAREFIHTALRDESERKRHSLGHELFQTLLTKRVLPVNRKTDSVFGYGIFASPSSSTVARKLRAALGK